MGGVKLEQTQLAGPSSSLGAALHLEFAEDAAVMTFDCVQCQEEPCADLLVGQTLRNQLQYFQLTLSQEFVGGLGSIIVSVRLGRKCSPQPANIVGHHVAFSSLRQQ